MAAVMAAETPADLQGVLRTAANPKIMDKIYEAWLNSILSGVKTHVVNTTSNALMQGLEGATRPLAAVNEAVGAAIKGRPRERFVREIVADAKGAIDGIKAGFIAAKNALDGVYVGSGKLEHVHALPDKVLGVPTPAGCSRSRTSSSRHSLAPERHMFKRIERADLPGSPMAMRWMRSLKCLGA